MTKIAVLEFDEVPYGQALALQQQLRETLIASGDPGFLCVLEHPPVVTLGKRGSLKDIANEAGLTNYQAEVFQIDRGGEATYHGPGQLVIYPILNLKSLGLGVVDTVRGLAQVLAETVEALTGVELSYDPDSPGLWTTEQPPRKMASVGMRISRGISTHGAAINLNTDLIPFSYIVACGMTNAPMTRLRDYVDGPIDTGAFRAEFLKRFAAHFSVTLETVDMELPANSDAVKPTVSFKSQKLDKI